MTWSSGAVSFTQSPNRRSGFTLAKGSEVEQKSSHAARLSGRVVSVVSLLVNEWRRISRDHYDWSSGHCENLHLMKTLQWPAECVHPGKKSVHVSSVGFPQVMVLCWWVQRIMTDSWPLETAASWNGGSICGDWKVSLAPTRTSF